MKKRIVVLFVFVVLMVLLAGCAKADKNLVWYEDFSSTETDDTWMSDVDMNYVCSEYLPGSEDILARTIQEESPSGDNLVAVSVANPSGKGATNVNMIRHKRFEVVDQSTYVLTGFMRAAPDYDLEMINPALEFCADGTCWYAEIVYYLNPYVNQETHMAIGDPYYAGLMYTRGPVPEIMNFLVEMGDDREWHFFVLQVSVDLSSDTPFLMDRVIIDYFAEEGEGNLEHNFVNKYLNVPMWAEDKGGNYADGGQVFLEVHNMNSNCDPELSFTGVGLWDDIALYRYPLGEAPKTVSARP